MIDWFLQNWTACIPAIAACILGIFGILFKFKRDDKAGVFNTPTSLGLLAIILLIVVGTCNVSSQYQTYLKNKNVTDSVNNKAYIDSINNVTRFLKLGQYDDSIIHNQQLQSGADSIISSNTITGFEKQILLDSINKQNDSSRFTITLKKFGEELTSQNTALQSLNNVLHPIFPLTVMATLEINIDSMSKELNIAYTLKKLENSEDVRLGDAFLLFTKSMRDGNLMLVKHKYNKPLTVNDSLQSKINRLVPSYIYLRILEGTNTNDKPVFTTLIDDQHMEYSYNYNFRSKILTLKVYSDIDTKDVSVNNITTFEQAKKDFLWVGFNNFKFKSEFRLISFNFYCGQTFYNNYLFNFTEQYAQGFYYNDNKTYIIGMNNALKP